MGLSLQGIQTIKKNKIYLITSLITALALIAQPLHGNLIDKVASALANSTPTTPTIALHDQSGVSIPNHGYIKTERFTFTLNNSPDEQVGKYRLIYCNNITEPGRNDLNCNTKSWRLDDISGYSTSPATLSKYVDRFSRGEGTHYFKFSACDATGNCSDFSDPFTVTYDKTQPKAPAILGFTQNSNDRTVVNVPISSKVNSNGVSPNTTHMLWNTDTDEYSKDKLRAIQYEVTYPNGSKRIVGDNNGPTGINFVTAWVGGVFGPKNTNYLIDGSPEGSYVFRLRVQHANGIWSDWSTGADLVYDNTAPGLDIASVDVNKSNKTATINGTTTDGDSAVIVKVDGKEYTIDPSDFERDVEVYKWTVTTDPLNIEKYTATANSRDEAGNEADEVESEEFEIKPPAFTSDGSGNSTAGASGQNLQPSGIGPTPPSIPTPARRQIAQLTTPVVNDDSTTDNESISSSTKSTAKRQSAKSTDGENGEVLAAGNTNQNWSVVNLLLTITTGVMGSFAVAGAFIKGRRNRFTRLIGLIPTIASIVTIIFVENFYGTMGFVNLWTMLFAALMTIQIAIFAKTKIKA